MTRRTRPRRRPVRVMWLLLAGAALALTPGRAHADRVDRLAKILLTDPSYKVRLQAAIGLGKLKEKRAVPALSSALKDSEYTVRALSASALGQILDRRALPALKRMLKREKNGFARSQAQKAIEALEASGASAAGVRFLVMTGKMINKAPKGGNALADALAVGLIKEFRTVKGVTTDWGGRKPNTGELKKKGVKAFVLDGSVLSATSKPTAGGMVEISCTIRVSLATFPGNSMKAFYSGGASMEVASSDLSPATEVNLYKEVIAGAAQGAKQQIVNSYLSTQ